MSGDKNLQVCPIIVIGSCFIDHVAYTRRLPESGETVYSTSFSKHFGGKGANQAVMIAKLGAKPSLVTLVGGEEEMISYRDSCSQLGIRTDYFLSGGKNCSSGAALITVDENGNNTIVICPNVVRQFTPSVLIERAPHWFAPRDIAEFKPSLVPLSDASCRISGIALCQNEIPPETTAYVMQQAFVKHRMYTILNPAPAPETVEELKYFEQNIFPFVSLLCLNQKEAALFCDGMKVDTVENAYSALAMLHKKMRAAERDTKPIIVVTLGELGAAYSEHEGSSHHIPGLYVPMELIVDTTGAGDAFVGALAHYISEGCCILKAVENAVFISGQTIKKVGTQASYPTLSELN